MRRYNYGQNFQAFNSSKFNWLTPLGFVEVAPGETISGKFTTHAWSDTTLRPVMNRTYFDTYAFYVPYRLLWDDWTTFISDRESGLQPPASTGTSEFFFERQTAGTDECVYWNRAAYNLIRNKYFRLPQEEEASLDNAIAARCSNRQTTFHESAFDEADIPRQTVTVVDGEVDIDDLRSGFAQDRFNKIRTFYGDKYTDYLAALGVKSSWSIADEPEFIGRASKDFVYRNVNATITEPQDPTPDNFLGDSAGYFDSQNACRIRPTFCPEHGLIVMLGVARMDIVNMQGSISPWLAKRQYNSYYSPEFETEKVRSWTGKLWGDANGANPPNYTRYFEDYRKPSNQVGRNNENTNKDNLYFFSIGNGTADVSEYLTPNPDVFDQLFTGTMGGNTEVHYTVNNQVRMLKKSPVRPPAPIAGVS